MPTDPRRLRPGELCRIVNSTPVGTVLAERMLRSHRQQAGLRIGDDKHVDLIRYTAWLAARRHQVKVAPATENTSHDVAQSALGAAALGSRRKDMEGNGQKLTGKQEALIAALLTEPTYAQAAAKAGVGETTLYRWMHLPEFRTSYRQARRELIEGAIGRLQAASGHAVDTLVTVARHGKRDSDRIRAAQALLQQAWLGLTEAERLHGNPDTSESPRLGATEIVNLLSQKIQQLDQADASATEQARLIRPLTDALINAIGLETLVERVEAIEVILDEREKR